MNVHYRLVLSSIVHQQFLFLFWCDEFSPVKLLTDSIQKFVLHNSVPSLFNSNEALPYVVLDDALIYTLWWLSLGL